MWKLLALLPCLLLVCEVKADCDQALACENLVTDSSLLTEEISLVGYEDEAEVLDTICTELAPVTSCLNEYLPSCTEEAIKDKVTAAKKVVEYVCSVRGKQVVLNLTQSECHDDPMAEVHIQLKMLDCLEDFQFALQMAQLEALIDDREFQYSESCPYIDDLKVCIVNGAVDLCGPSMGIFVGDIWNIMAASEFDEFGCGGDDEEEGNNSGSSASSVNQARRAVKRALPMVMKRAALIKKHFIK